MEQMRSGADGRGGSGLSRMLAREQRAFLGRPRREWAGHLDRARAFFGEGLERADPSRPVLILGAGSGLEIPWRLAPAGTVGWDADPWSRARTCLRHGRFPEWVFEDLTGGLGALEATALRASRLPGRELRRSPERAAMRLAGLLPSLRPEARALRAWVEVRRPGTILVANVLGQIGVVARTLVERTLGPDAWDETPEGTEPLAEALDAWTTRALGALQSCLAESGAEVWMLHDRAVIWGDPDVSLGPLEDSWKAQIQSRGPIEVSDPLCGQELRAAFRGRQERHFDRWMWPVGPGQLHMMEALAYSSEYPNRTLDTALGPDSAKTWES